MAILTPTPRRTRWLIPVLILLLTALTRLWNFGNVPPGLQHDELFYAEDARSIIQDGNWRIFYINNQGREGGYIWFLAGMQLIFGQSMITVRIPGLWVSLLTMALLYRFARDVVSYRAAVMATALGAVTFWPVFIGRVGLRAATLPLVALIVLWGVWRVTYQIVPDGGTRWRRWRTSLLTGVALGFSAYTYTAWFVLFAAFASYFPALLVLDFRRFRQRWRQLALTGIVALALAFPMLRLYLDGTISSARVNNINDPWREFTEGKPEKLLHNAAQIAGMPFVTGDPEWRYNISGRPFFASGLGAFAYAGLLILLWRARKRPIYVMLLALIAFGIIPSLLTISAPSFLRMVILFPILLLVVALAVDTIASVESSSVKWSRAAWVIGLLGIVATAGIDLPAYFVVWARTDEVRAVYREDVRLLGQFLVRRGEPLAMVSTNAPDEYLDPLLYTYSVPADRRVPLVWFNGQTDIVLSEKPLLLFVSPLSPINEPQREWLTPANGTEVLSPLYTADGKKLFDVYRIAASGTVLRDRIERAAQWPAYLVTPDSFRSPDVREWGQPLAFPINFGNLFLLRAVHFPQGKPLPEFAVLNGWPGVNMQLYVQPLTDRYPVPLTIFVHVLSADGKTVLRQRDFLGTPTHSWHTAITFAEDHYTPIPQHVVGQYWVTLGAYNLINGQRVPIYDANGKPLGDRVLLAGVENTEQNQK